MANMQGSQGGAGDDGLSAKERLARRKEEERRKRELELQLASMNVHVGSRVCRGGCGDVRKGVRQALGIIYVHNKFD